MNILYLLNPKESVAYIYEDNNLRQGLEKMKRHRYSAIPVLSRDGKYVGTVTEGDFLWYILINCYGNESKQEMHKVSDIIRRGWNSAVRISETMEDLLLRVMDQNFVPVVDDRDLFVGIVTRRDVMKNCVNIR